MASLTQWTWVWVNFGSWWWTGKPGVLLFMGSQIVGHDWVTELNWTYTQNCLGIWSGYNNGRELDLMEWWGLGIQQMKPTRRHSEAKLLLGCFLAFDLFFFWITHLSHLFIFFLLTYGYSVYFDYVLKCFAVCMRPRKLYINCFKPFCYGATDKIPQPNGLNNRHLISYSSGVSKSKITITAHLVLWGLSPGLADSCCEIIENVHPALSPFAGADLPKPLWCPRW